MWTILFSPRNATDHTVLQPPFSGQSPISRSWISLPGWRPHTPPTAKDHHVLPARRCCRDHAPWCSDSACHASHQLILVGDAVEEAIAAASVVDIRAAFHTGLPS